MDSEEISEWFAFSRIIPLANPWLQTGVLAAVTSNAWFKGNRKPEDFMPVAPRPRQPRQQSPAEVIAIMRMFASCIPAKKEE